MESPKKGRGRPPADKSAKLAKVERKRKRKAKRGENTIKKPTSAYIYFVAHYRSELKKKGEPTNKVQEIAKTCGELWKKMDDNDKKPFNALAAKDKARYQESRSEEDKAKGKDPNKPKRAPTAYFLFLADFREELKKNPPPEGSKIPTLAGEKWKTMTPGDKVRYNEQAEKEKILYQKNMEAYRKTNPIEPKAAKKAAPAPPKKRKPEPVPEEASDEEEDEEDDDDEEEEDEDSDE